MPVNVRSARALAAAERRARVVELRRSRLTFAEIGRELGITESAAWRHYQKALASVPSPAVEQHRAEELVLIDDAIRDLLDLARDHRRPRYAVEAWNAICRWSERKDRLLGLNAPTKRTLEVVEQDVIDREIERLSAELAAEGVAPGKARVPREPSGAELGDAWPG